MSPTPRRVLKGLVLAALGVGILGNTGCVWTYHAVNPRPNVIITGETGTYGVRISRRIEDIQELNGLKIEDVYATLTAGFKNAVGDRFEPASRAGLVLSIDQADFDMANLGVYGRFLNVRFKAKWTTADGRVVAQVAGIAKPRNPLETGPRHIEDVVEVMYELMVDGLNKSAAPAAPAPVVEQPRRHDAPAVRSVSSRRRGSI